jgi:hypothetical protein
MNDETPAKPRNSWAMPAALLMLAAYFVLGIVSGGAERGWWS